MANKICKSIIYKHPFKGSPTSENFKIVDEKLRPLKDNEFLAEAVYIKAGPHVEAATSVIKVNTVPKAIQLAKITATRNNNFSEGQFVIGNFGWQTHTIIDSCKQKDVYLMPNTYNFPETLSLGVLGIPGFAAYFGFLEICRPRKNDVVVVSSAAGTVGSCVGQIAKIKGCTVIGITSTNEKCLWLSEIGFDHCINYKKEKVEEKLKEYAPNGVDCYFDTVGGEVSSSIIYQMALHSRICICGATALYYNEDVKVHEVQSPIKIKQAKMEGFHVDSWKNQWNVAIEQHLQWITENKLKYKETIIQKIENMPETYVNVLKGKYYGNVIIKV